MRVCVYVCVVCVHICVSVWMCKCCVNVYVKVCVYACVYVCICACAYVYMCIYAYVCTCAISNTTVAQDQKIWNHVPWVVQRDVAQRLLENLSFTKDVSDYIWVARLQDCLDVILVSEFSPKVHPNAALTRHAWSTCMHIPALCQYMTIAILSSQDGNIFSFMTQALHLLAEDTGCVFLHRKTAKSNVLPY